MGAKTWIVCCVAAAAIVAGCTGPQGRKSRPELGVTDEMLERERYLHGGPGTEIALLFNTGDIKRDRGDSTGAGRGLQGTEFYQVQVAPDPRQPTRLVKVGFARKVQEDRGGLYFYEFFDGGWETIGRLMSGGELYSYRGGREALLGQYDINGAVVRLYPAASGYGYDQVLQDQSRPRMSDPDITGLDSRGRGVYHNTHGTYPPVVVFTMYRPGEVRQLGQSWERTRFDEAEALKLEREREKRHGGIGQDETYGGLPYRKGDPVDANGQPLRPTGAGK